MEKTVGFQPQTRLNKHKEKAEALFLQCLRLVFYSVIPKCDSPLIISANLRKSWSKTYGFPHFVAFLFFLI